MKDNVLSQKKIINLLQRASFCRLATSGAEFPYIVPLCFLYYNEHLYFHSRLTGKKISEITTNPRICMQIDDITGLSRSSKPCKFNIAYESVIVEGVAKIIENGAQKKEVLDLLAQKYSDGQNLLPIEKVDVERVAVVEVFIENMSGKVNI